jgi:hypothetical protein
MLRWYGLADRTETKEEFKMNNLIINFTGVFYHHEDDIRSRIRIRRCIRHIHPSWIFFLYI